MSENDPIKERVTKLIERLDAENSLKDYVHIWITSGREIENYIPAELFEQVLFSDQFRRHFIYVSILHNSIFDTKTAGSYTA